MFGFKTFLNDLVSYINIHVHIPLFFDVVYTQVHCCRNMFFFSLDYISSYRVWCVLVFHSLSYMNMHILYCFCCGTNIYCLPIKYRNLISFYCSTKFRVCQSFMIVHIPIVLCCGAKRYCLPTHYRNIGVIIIIKAYPFTKF